MWGHIARLSVNNYYFKKKRQITDLLGEKFKNKEKVNPHNQGFVKKEIEIKQHLKVVSNNYKVSKDEQKVYEPPVYYGLDRIIHHDFMLEIGSRIIEADELDEPSDKIENNSTKHQQQSTPTTTPTTPTKLFDENSLSIATYQANNPTQDRIISNKIPSLNAMAISVFDGHGGNILSDYAAQMFSDLLDKRVKYLIDNNYEPSTQAILKNAILWAYQQIQEKFYQIFQSQFRAGNKDVLKVGSCAITVVLYDDSILVANLGDSQAIVLKEQEFEEKTSLKCIQLNERLSVNSQKEKKRLKQKFKEIDSEVVTKDQHGRLYLKGLLQPTKTLGDYYLKKQKYFNKLGIYYGEFKGPYLDCIPEFHTYKIQSNFKYLIVASDGIWDFLSKKEIQEQMMTKSEEQLDVDDGQFSFVDLNKTYLQTPSAQNKQIESLALKLQNSALTKSAKKKGLSLNQLINLDPSIRRNYCDDISVSVMKFDPSPKNYHNSFSIN